MKTTDPFMKPTVNVNYFRTDFDLDVQVAASRLSRRVLTSPPMRYVLSSSSKKVETLITRFLTRSSLSTGETIPGNAVPDNANRGSDQDWKNWIRANFNAVSHPVGTCAMMRRNLGGKRLFAPLAAV